MTLIFLDVAAVEILHAQQLKRFGGAHGLRNRGLLESAVSRAESKRHYDPNASIPKIAACLGFGLIKNHAFVDGNKRIGLASTVATLRLNGFLLTVPQSEQVRIVQAVAASEISEAQWTAWVVQYSKPIR